jgi:hypothetical protein
MSARIQKMRIGPQRHRHQSAPAFPLLIYANAHSRGNLIWTVRSTGKQLSMCGYEFDTVNPNHAWLRLIYALSGTKDQLNYRVNLTTTQPRYGGVRWWMVCPLMKNRSQCSRRAGRLYLPPGAKYFGCRQCYEITYTSCQESHIYDRVFANLAKGFPGMSGKDVKKLLESGLS